MALYISSLGLSQRLDVLLLIVMMSFSYMFTDSTF